MSDIFITADEHYGHDNIIRYCDRPFQNTEHMQEELIARHNDLVPDSKSFLTIHVGDIFWESMDEDRAVRILDLLHGRHAFLWGNHDKLVERSVLLRGRFEWVRDVHTLHFNKRKLTLCHYAMRVWPGSHKGQWHVYGHSHGELPGLGRSFDIGVDCHDYRPWSLEEIAARMEKLPCHQVIEKTWPGRELSKVE